MTLPKVLAATVIRGAARGQSHGGVHLIDLENCRSQLVLDWDTRDIDFVGRGGDRGLRGIAIAGDDIYIAASSELLVLNRAFGVRRAYRNRYLGYCQEIALYNDQLFLTSAGYDSILVFDIRSARFVWGLHLRQSATQVLARTFDPEGVTGPLQRAELHINSICCNSRAMLISGLRHDRILRFSRRGLDIFGPLPQGTHNMQMYRKGILFNDTAGDCVRFVNGRESLRFDVPKYHERLMERPADMGEAVARPFFARGLCPLGAGLVAAGSSPSTVAVHDLVSGRTVKCVNISMDVRNCIHGLAVWPYGRE